MSTAQSLETITATSTVPPTSEASATPSPTEPATSTPSPTQRSTSTKAPTRRPTATRVPPTPIPPTAVPTAVPKKCHQLKCRRHRQLKRQHCHRRSWQTMRILSRSAAGQPGHRYRVRWIIPFQSIQSITPTHLRNCWRLLGCPVHILLDGSEIYTSNFLGPITGNTSSGWLNSGPVSPGSHTLILRPEGRSTGQPGDCNTGTLGGWAGTVQVKTNYYP